MPRVYNNKKICYTLPRNRVSVSYGNLRTSRITNFKSRFFHRVKELFKSNPTRYGASFVYLKSQTKRNFCYTLPRKKVSISYRNLRISRITNFKKVFSSGQGDAQIKPNSAWSIPCVPRVYNNKKICYTLPRKRVSISYGNLQISRITNFKSRFFHRVKELFKSNRTRYGVSFLYLESKQKEIFAIPCLEKKLVFYTEICELRE